ncbi:hypothetical protein CC80DRAFT_110541 [Byssothecium circinans]|uniref:Uncharacterized protein n=1 Tax=Byssothecium circinans TaxID=147558 RepID=A0A6A5TQN8_9PLEO|nr:hypothetical protein CC80DRAFT_110541 [Byssothecium circinans]
MQAPNPTIKLSIHTPAFYSSLVGYDFIISVFLRAILLEPCPENQTASCAENLDQLLSLVESATCMAYFGEDWVEAQTPLTSLLSGISRLFPLKYSSPTYLGRNRAVRKSEGNQTRKKDRVQYGIFLLPFVRLCCTARLQWWFYIALLQVLAWRLVVKLSGGWLAWGR